MQSQGSSPSRPSSSPSGCCGNPPFSGTKQTILFWWKNGISYEEYEKLKNWGYPITDVYFTLEEVKRMIYFTEKAPGKPTEDDGFEAEKGWDGKNLKKRTSR